MSTILTYEPDVYQQLSNSDGMHEIAGQRIDELLVLGEIVCKHGLEKIAGVYLIHRHHDLVESERFVWELADDQWHGRPRICEDAELASTNWKVVGNDERAVWRPLEFVPIAEAYKPEIDAAAAILEHTAFLDDFKMAAIRLGVQDIFGVSIHQCREKFIRPGMMMFEQSYLSRRVSAAWLVPSNHAEQTDGVTLWHFTPQRGRYTVRACAHGNSRCCCGG